MTRIRRRPSDYSNALSGIPLPSSLLLLGFISIPAMGPHNHVLGQPHLRCSSLSIILIIGINLNQNNSTKEVNNRISINELISPLYC